MRADPKSVEVVERAAHALTRHPRVLESLLWRHLAAEKWTESPLATRAALDALRSLYRKSLRKRVMAKALANARDLLGQ